MPDRWFYLRNKQRHGPVTSAKLKQMAKEGWLVEDDLVWCEELPDWVPASTIRGLFSTPLSKRLPEVITGVQSKPPVAPPTPSEKAATPAPRRFDLGELHARHLLAIGGGVVAALGMTLTAIQHSALALTLTLVGLLFVAAGLHKELGKLISQAIENIGKASREAADRRLKAKQLAVEKQRLDLEEKKLAQANAAVTGEIVRVTHPQAQSEEIPASGSVVVINQAPVQRWSPGVAAVLSFLIPGLGQMYKGQIINGLVWFVFVLLGYAALIVPGLFLHLFCIVGAASGNPWTQGNTTVVRR